MKITCVTLLTRLWMLDEIAEQIKTEQSDDYELDVLIICDNIHIPKHHIESAYQNIPHKIIYTEREPSSETGITERRQHITDALNLARANITSGTKYVWVLEDDTTIQPGTLQRLLSHMTNKIGLVSGIQAGRHAFKILGLWNAVELDPKHRKYEHPEHPSIMETLPYLPDYPLDFQYLHAAGLYCTLTQAHLFRETPFRHAHLGPDFYYGWDLFRKSYYNLADHKIICGHKTQNQTIYPDENCIATRWTVQANGELWPEILDKINP